MAERERESERWNRAGVFVGQLGESTSATGKQQWVKDREGGTERKAGKQRVGGGWG